MLGKLRGTEECFGGGVNGRLTTMKLGHYPGATARLDFYWIDGNGEATSGGAPDAENNDGRNTMVVSFWDEN
uniref:Uncharacterized protein n=1 Tax=Oryza rufipogon TaxID=4529 RepID=A0A0E0QFQ4_ORYRU